MPEFLKLHAPDDARRVLLEKLAAPLPGSETIQTVHGLGRIVAVDIYAQHPLPEFPRSSMDGYAVRARDTFGASDALPAYLALVGEVPMGGASDFVLEPGQCALIHTGGMLPDGADAVVMQEYAQTTGGGGSRGVFEGTPVPAEEIEVLRAVADGENVIRVGEDVVAGQLVLPRGSKLTPAQIGGLMALGVIEVRVATKIKVGLISTGDEVIPPDRRPAPGQVRDVNTHTLSVLIEQTGGEVVGYGILPDRFDVMQPLARRAFEDSDVLIITAGSSASTRDMTARMINTLGAPGVLVHGINIRPGKPTILGVCDGKAVVGLPGNPVSALVNGYLFVVPVIERLLGAQPRPRPSVLARLTVNLASQAGREDWWPVHLVAAPTTEHAELAGGQMNRSAISALSAVKYQAKPIFGKSNLIFTLAAADGLLKIPVDSTGLEAGEVVEVHSL